MNELCIHSSCGYKPEVVQYKLTEYMRIDMISKQKLIDYITEQTSLSKTDATEGINALTEAIAYYLSKGESIHILNFGTFKVRNHKSRVSHNVQSRKKFLLKEQNIPIFKVSKILKDKTNWIANNSKIKK